MRQKLIFTIARAFCILGFFALNGWAEDNSKILKVDDNATAYWIQDNAQEMLNPPKLFGEASEALFTQLNLTQGVPASMGTFLLKADGEYILFDTGLGKERGQLFTQLAKLGVSPDSIKKIYITHMHLDHIGGLVSSGKKNFKNATLYISQVEFDVWTKELPNNDLQKEVAKVYKENINLFKFGDTLPHQILAMDAAGHTPGHTVFQKGNLLIVGDLMHGYALQINHPEINSNYDKDKENSIKARRYFLDYAQKNKLTMGGMHFPAPGFQKNW